MSRDFGITDPEDIKFIEMFKSELAKRPQSYWDNEMRNINKICTDIREKSDQDLWIGAGSGD